MTSESDASMLDSDPKQLEPKHIGVSKQQTLRKFPYQPTGQQLVEKSVIVHRDENGFGLRIKGQAPIFVEHVHENGAAWRAGVRRWDCISKVNGTPVSLLDHKQVVLMFKNCTRFVSLTLISNCKAIQSDSQEKAEVMLKPHQPLEPGELLQASHFRLAACLHGQPTKFTQGQLIRSILYNASRRSILDWAQPGGGVSLAQAAYQQAEPAPTSGGQPAMARRSGSVAIRPSYLSRLNDGGLAAQHPQPIQRPVERRGSALEPALCPSCRGLESASEAHLDTQCAQCHLKLQHLRQRPYASMKDPARPLLVQQQPTPANTNDTMHQDSKHLAARNIHKLSLSASMVSLSRGPQSAASSGKSTGAEPSPSIINSMQNNSTTNSSLASLQIFQRTLGRPTNQRLEIIRELIDTEKTHIDRLKCLDKLFYQPLKAGKLMAADQLHMVFSCHQDLYKIHSKIYRILLSTVNCNQWSQHHLTAPYGPLIGSALLEIFDGKLKRRLQRDAGIFCAAQSINVELLNKLTRRDTKVGDFLAQVTSQQMVGRLGIKDLLASCFQRLTKYPLLLESLLKATPASPPPVAPIAPSSGTGSKIAPRRKRLCNSRQLSLGQACGRPKLTSGSLDEEAPDVTSQTDSETCEDEHQARVGNHEELAYEDLDEEEDDNDQEEEEEEEEEEEDEESEIERNSRRMLALSLAEERDSISRALQLSRQILVRVNESINVARLKEIWKRTEKHPGYESIDISKQQLVHDGLLTLRLAKRSYDVYVLLLNDYIIILTKESQDRYRLKFFTPEGKSSSSLSSSSNSQNCNVYPPVFVIDEHLTTRDAATDENGFYLLCKRRDDSRIYEFSCRSPAERVKWRDKIQWAIERQMNKADRRPSCESTITKSSSEISARQEGEEVVGQLDNRSLASSNNTTNTNHDQNKQRANSDKRSQVSPNHSEVQSSSSYSNVTGQPTKIEGTISYVEDDGIVLPSRMESSRALVNEAIQVTIFEAMQKQQVSTSS